MPNTCDGEIWERQVRFLSHFVSNAALAQSALATSRIPVVDSGGLPQEIASALRSIGIERIAEMEEPSTLQTEAGPVPAVDLIVACEVSTGFELFETVNQSCLANGTMCLRMAISGASAQLGPTVVLFENACYTCLDLRRQTHEADLQGYLAYLAQSVDTNGPDNGTAPARLGGVRPSRVGR